MASFWVDCRKKAYFLEKLHCKNPPACCDSSPSHPEWSKQEELYRLLWHFMMAIF
jgi:hypothetical protein